MIWVNKNWSFDIFIRYVLTAYTLCFCFTQLCSFAIYRKLRIGEEPDPPALIWFKWEHDYSLVSLDAFKQRRLGSATKDAMRDMVDHGLTPGLIVNEAKDRVSAGLSGVEEAITLSDLSVVPSYMQAYS